MAALLAPTLFWAAGLDPALAARLVSAKGSDTDGYGRLVLTFDKPVTVKATVSGGILILGYGERATAGPERLSEELAGYVAAVRRDPDGTGLRLALQKPVRANVQLAGERVFVDLLPESWKGLPPALPQDVVADLARRARAPRRRCRRARPFRRRRRWASTSPSCRRSRDSPCACPRASRPP